MRDLLRAEGYKLRKNGAFHILGYFMVVAVIIYPLFTYLSYPKDSGARIALTGIELYVNAMMMNQFFLKISLGVLAGFFISNEYASGVLKRIVSAGVGRRRIYAAKLGIYSLGIVLIALLVPVLAGMISSLMSRLGLLSAAGSSLNIAPAVYGLRMIGFTVIFAAAFAAIAAFIAVIMADSGKTVGVSIVFFLFIDQILQVLGAHYAFFKAVYDYSLFKLYAATIAYRMDGHGLILSVIVPAATFAVFAFLGAQIFRRKEIQ